MSAKLEDIYEPIGKLVVRFQNLELFMNLLLIDLLKQDYDTGFCVTSEMSFSRLVASLVSVAEVRIKDVTLVEEMRKVAGQLNICEDARNKVLHSRYASSNDGKPKRAKITAKQRNGLKKSIYDASVQEICEYIKQIEDATMQIDSLGCKLKAQGMISSAYLNDHAP
jgi:hypothetical protein